MGNLGFFRPTEGGVEGLFPVFAESVKLPLKPLYPHLSETNQKVLQTQV